MTSWPSERSKLTSFGPEMRQRVLPRHVLVAYLSLATLGRRWSISEIFEVGRDAEVATTHELNDGLQFVFLFPGDANLAVL